MTATDGRAMRLNLTTYMCDRVIAYFVCSTAKKGFYHNLVNDERTLAKSSLSCIDDHWANEVFPLFPKFFPHLNISNYRGNRIGDKSVDVIVANVINGTPEAFYIEENYLGAPAKKQLRTAWEASAKPIGNESNRSLYGLWL